MITNSDILRRMIRELGISQNEFSIRVGVSHRMMEHYLQGGKYKVPKKIMQSARWAYYNEYGELFNEFE